jgi:putative sigma-54 modulation protein
VNLDVRPAARPPPNAPPGNSLTVAKPVAWVGLYALRVVATMYGLVDRTRRDLSRFSPGRTRWSPADWWSYQRESLSVEIKISARHGHFSDQTKAKIEAKVEKLSRLFERLMEIEVTVDLEQADNPEVELIVHAEHRKDFIATVKAGELMAALDAALHKIEGQLRKYKSKVQDHHRADKTAPETEAND